MTGRPKDARTAARERIKTLDDALLAPGHRAAAGERMNALDDAFLDDLRSAALARARAARAAGRRISALGAA